MRSAQASRRDVCKAKRPPDRSIPSLLRPLLCSACCAASSETVLAAARKPRTTNRPARLVLQDNKGPARARASQDACFAQFAPLSTTTTKQTTLACPICRRPSSLQSVTCTKAEPFEDRLHPLSGPTAVIVQRPLPPATRPTAPRRRCTGNQVMNAWRCTDARPSARARPRPGMRAQEQPQQRQRQFEVRVQMLKWEDTALIDLPAIAATSAAMTTPALPTSPAALVVSDATSSFQCVLPTPHR